MKHVIRLCAQPEHFFTCLRDSEKRVCFLNSCTRGGWQRTIAWNPSASFVYKKKRAKNGGVLTEIRNFVATQGEKGRKIAGYFSYDFGCEMRGIKQKARDDLRLPDVYLLAYDNWVNFGEKKVTIYYKNKNFLEKVKELLSTAGKRNNPSLNGLPPFTVPFRASITASQYKKSFQKIKQYIKDGHTYQINITHRMQGKTTVPPRLLFLEVLKKNPVDFAAYLEGDGFEILSASPERFVKITGRAIETCPIKGTRARGETKEEDERLKQELLTNVKEQAELDMITDLQRNDIGKVCQFGTVKVRGRRLISPCETVWHTYSRITGQLRDAIQPVRALLSMLPGGSVTGCPKKRSLEIIDELEPYTRSVYCGTIGYIEPNGDIDFNIAIRTIIKKGKKVYLSVGGGVVYDSDCEAEFRETLEKAKSFL